ncbi:MAG: ATP-binding protein [Myxococcota bacterium]
MDQRVLVDPIDVQDGVGTLFYTTRESGTGLGIAQCRRIVGRVGGTLDIQSTEGSGTQVTVTLPR